ncbi:shikimate dehydrogenase [Roseomonas sp. HF4]|uniref:shikimate dehydrogenase family protein n=1 Tax=Roseomonas sp. HF4 TaxID=2562313 RepID=UPI0010C0C851|nr:shikimate dehydrogenase [Roseomonas sp. HF4]
MTITGATRLFGILGDPVAVVRSPAWWNALFARAGRDAVFLPFQVSAADLPRAWAGLTAIGNLDGLVLTMPHKQAVLPLLDALGPAARLVGAANTVRRLPDGSWEGDMFDGEGFVAGLRAQGIAPEGRRVRQVGCGGAGRAIAFALARAGVAALALEDAAPGRAAALAAEVVAAFPGVAMAGVPDLLVNATPTGLAPGDGMVFDASLLAPRVAVADVIPNPEVTPLVAAARAAGCTVATGRDMFEGQARLAAAYFGIAA